MAVMKQIAGVGLVPMDADDIAQRAATDAATAEREAKLGYVERRRRAYPSVTEQLDALWKGGAEAEAMRARVAQVKADHPKPEER